MFKKLICAFLIFILPFAAPASDYGAGFILGSPTAITGKMYVNPETAYDLGFAFSSSDYVLLYADYLRHYPKSEFFKESKIRGVSPYIGIGGIAAISTTSRSKNDKYLGTSSGSIGLGVRVPFGLEWKLSSPPLGFFAEIAPGISVIPATEILVNAGVGIRYLF